MKASNDSHPKVVVRKTVRAKREAVFDAWTKPELMEKWFFPGNWTAKTTNDLRVGGSYTHDMISDGSACACQEGEEEISKHNVHTGQYVEISRPERLVFTWNSDIVKNSRVTVELKDLGASTEIIITHELLETEELRTRHAGGWEACLAKLDAFLG